MNRRDTIIVAVLLNAAIIAVLLLMAVNTDEEVLYDRPSSTVEPLAEVSMTLIPPSAQPEEVEVVGFEGMLGDYPSTPDDYFLVDDDLGLIPEKPAQLIKPEQPTPTREMDDVRVVDIVVKKGDSLDKIARANGTTIEAIKQASQLKSEKLSIGQKLKVPVGLKKVAAIPADKPVATPAESAASKDSEYYTLKSGDTPWKIAKQQHVSMEDILRLNKLNEEKARNLKVGDKIRIR